MRLLLNENLDSPRSVDVEQIAAIIRAKEQRQ